VRFVTRAAVKRLLKDAGHVVKAASSVSPSVAPSAHVAKAAMILAVPILAVKLSCIVYSITDLL